MHQVEVYGSYARERVPMTSRAFLPTRVVRALAALSVFASASGAWAQNYREMPIGGRTATMGGAGTAAGNDSAMPYLNPAGLAGVPGDIFAVPPDHDSWVVGDEPYVSLHFMGADTYAS